MAELGSAGVTPRSPGEASALARFQTDHPLPGSAGLAVVIAAFDEADSIGAVLADVPETVCGLDVDVIVVDDGSTDGTAAVASAHGAKVCRIDTNQGQGAALRLGYELARRRGALFVATLDADGQYDPAELPLVVQPLVDGEADFVSGSRRLGANHHRDLARSTGVVVFAGILSVLAHYRITDPANGLRAMRVEVTEAVPLRQPQYQAAELLLGAARRGFRIAEVATTMRPRSAGATKKGRNLLYGLRFARAIASTWLGSRGAKTTRSNTANFTRKSTP